LRNKERRDADYFLESRFYLQSSHSTLNYLIKHQQVNQETAWGSAPHFLYTHRFTLAAPLVAMEMVSGYEGTLIEWQIAKRV
jgi:hypothetical protein